jgi:signal transduction histidine kinase
MDKPWSWPVVDWGAGSHQVHRAIADVARSWLHALRPRPSSTVSSDLGSVEEIPDSGQYAALWTALACITALLVLVPGIPVAIYQPRLSVAVGSISGVVGLALVQLGLLRFRVLRRPIDLHTGLAFGWLALGNLFAAWNPLPAANGELALEHAAYFLLLTRAAAAALFLTGFASTQRHERGSSWRWSGWLGLVCASIFGLLAIGALLDGDNRLPALLDPSAHQLLATGQSVTDLLPGQRPPLVLGNLALASVLLISAIGYTRESQRLRDTHIAALGAGMILIFFDQVNTVLFPRLPVDYVSAADGFRLVAYGLLLSNIMWHTGQDFAATATHNERMRLSRELHDGLAQQLAMLRLRLGRVAEITTMSDERSHDLEVAQRVLDSASMEARRAIAALRLEDVRWEDFEQALEAFAAEFSLTHELDGRVWAEDSDARLDSQLQADVLRILQESFSNAARHGHAKRIDAVVGLKGNALHMTVQDDGSGFDVRLARRGVGLRSMAERVERRNGTLAVDSVPGQGTRIQAWLPLEARRLGQL